MEEIRALKRQKIREARRAEIKELKKIRYEEKEEKEKIEVVVAKIKIEIKNLIRLQELQIEEYESEMKVFPEGNATLSDLKGRRLILKEHIVRLEHLFHESEKLEGELKSKHLLPVEVCDMFKEKLQKARWLLIQCRGDFRNFGEASAHIVWVYNTIPGAIRVERNLEKKKMQAIENQARM